MRHIVAVLLLIGLAFSATACVIEEPGPGPGPGPGHGRWCYWHPNRCR